MAVKQRYWYLTEPVTALGKKLQSPPCTDSLQEPIVMGFGMHVCIGC